MQIAESIINRKYFISTVTRFKKVFIRNEKFKIIISLRILMATGHHTSINLESDFIIISPVRDNWPLLA
jgi:hypothetical protein